MSIPDFRSRRTRGISLIELVMFIVIVGLAVAGVLLVMNVTTQNSADPMIRKQAIASAESLLEEVELQPFTYCFPTDANASTAGSSAGCASAANSEDTLPASARVTSPRSANNVSDYTNFSMSPIVDITGSAIAGLSNYTATVKIAQAGASFALPAAEVLQIDVRVVSGNTDVTVTGYRFRYAPNAVP
ncbi:MAG: type II secretion system protein [Pseudomonadota bacterium]|nr:type II secretion system protein [Pseudomonadota bacterium]